MSIKKSPMGAAQSQNLQNLQEGKASTRNPAASEESTQNPQTSEAPAQNQQNNDTLVLGGKTFTSRLLTGTGKFSDKKLIAPMVEASGTQLITMALRRVNFDMPHENVLTYIPKGVTLLPNTSGARNAEEAIKLARIARAAGCGDFIKIEVIHDAKFLMPDNDETIKATRVLAQEGFIVLPYMMPDIIAAKKLEDAGAAAVMPLGSAIGSNNGLQTKHMIEMIIDQCEKPIIVDAGIGKPSQAAEAMEMGASACLVNTAIACSEDPVVMGRAFALAVEAGRSAYLSGFASVSAHANASSPLTGFLFDDKPAGGAGGAGGAGSPATDTTTPGNTATKGGA